MNIPGILHNFQVESQSLATFLVKWNWNLNTNRVAYFQMSHSYQQANETKTIYSSFVPGTIMSSYILHNVEPHRVYQVCLTVFIKDSPLPQQRNNTEHFLVKNKSTVLSPSKICLISLTKANHIQAIASCLIGVVVALLLIGLIIILCRVHQRWTKSKFVKAELRGSNRDYYERHRNSETTATDDFSGFDDCETSCTSQMIAESLAWSPSSSLNSQLNLNILRSKSSLYNHSNSYPSSTPRIMEEDSFLDAFTDKVVETNNDDRQAQLNPTGNPEPIVMQSIQSPLFGTASSSTLNSTNYDSVGIHYHNRTDSIIANYQLVCEDEKTSSNVYLNESSNSDLVLQLVDEV